ncbi:hypothetical protein GE061_013426 [Apolygus lucorum]|uniref:Uncharacterized protein n=1 Tax=Apolygus lucorum TaxID=248454 RepID=A0A6A4KCI8_APOLU|nr:hypothetical protein GE061_013426 [Apolygus lucorum]
MSGPYEQFGSPFHYSNINANSPRKFRSPFVSPNNGQQDFPGSSPMKRNFGWRNNPNRNRFFHQNQNDQHNQYFSPRGGRRGGHFRGGGHHRGSPRNNADISLYVNQSMLCDPWKDLTELLEPRMRKSIDPKPTESADTSANDSRTSINTSASNNEVTEQVTEDSLLISDTSGNVSDQIIEECTPTKCSTTPTVHET